MAKKKERNCLREDIILQMTVSDIANLDIDRKKAIIDAVFGDAIELKEKFSHDVCEVFQSKLVEETMQKKSEVETEFKKCDTYLQDLQVKYDKAKENYEKALETMNETRKELFKAQKEHNSLQKEYDGIREDLEVRKKIREDMKQQVLIHPSASLKQVHRYRMSEIVVNDCDADCFERSLLDKICDTSKLVNLISVLPESLKGKQDRETDSIIKYCELVANTLAYVSEQNTSIKLLFNNFDIAKILRMNGIEF